MNAITQFDDSSLESNLAHYDIGELVRYWPAVNGIENSNYFVETRSGETRREFVLTIMEQPAYARDAYIPTMYALHNRGLPVAPPLATTGGYFIEAVAGKPSMLQARLPGKHVFNPTTRQLCALARFVARMHTTMAETKVELPPYPRESQWLGEQVNATRGLLPYNDSSLLQSSLGKVRSLLLREDVLALPQGMIHGDLFRDNILFNEYGLSGVLDFHHAASGFWIYDLAVIANDWCTDASGQLDSERTLAMLRAYHQVRPLKDAELWFFSAMAHYAALSFWLSRLQVALTAKQLAASEDESQARFKNPDEFKRIVAQHARHSFFLDARLLRV